MTTDLTGLISGAGKASGILSKFGVSIDAIGAPLAKLAQVGAAAGAGIATSVAALATKSALATDELNDLSDRLGTSIEGLGALRYAAKLTGSETEALTTAISKMNANLGDAAHLGSGPVDLALTRLGLDAKELAKEDPGEAFRKIAKALSAVSTPAERASLAMDIFGKGGMALMSTLRAGPEQIDKLVAEFRDLGGEVSKIDAQKIGTMWDAVDRLTTALGGAGNKLATVVAPYIERAADGLARFVAQNATMEQVSKTFKTIGEAAALVGDAVQAIGVAWAFVEMANDKANLTAIRGINLLYGGFDDLEKHLKQLAAESEARFQAAFGADFGGGIRDAIKAIGDEGLAAFNKLATSGKPAADALKGVSDKSVEAKEKISDMEKQLRAEVNTFGMASQEAEIYKLKQDGATDADVAALRALRGELDALEAKKKAQEDLKNELKQLAESTKLPTERLAEQEQRLKQLRASGQIDFNEFKRGMVNARDEAFKGNSEKRAGAITFGSSEFESALLRHQAGGDRQGNDIKDVVVETKKQTTVQEKMREALDKLVTALAGGNAGAISESLSAYPFGT